MSIYSSLLSRCSFPIQGIGIDLNEHIQQPVVKVFLPNPLDWDEVREDLFEFDNHVFLQENGEDHVEDEPSKPRDVGLDLNQIPELEGGDNDDFFGHEAPHVGEGSSSGRRQQKYYSDDTKRAVYAMLLEGSVDGRLPDGLSLQVSEAMNVSQRCVQHIWTQGQRGGGIHAVGNKKAKNCGRKQVELQPEAITAIPFQDRTTLVDLARSLGTLLKQKGGQHYAVPHMKKAALERLGELPMTLSCDLTIVEEAIEFLG